jgi:hypothetical protein
MISYNKRMFQFLKDKIPTSKGRHLKVSNSFSVSLDDFMATGERDAILASSGMGKSYLTGVIAEETLENNGLLCVIDPEGEYFTLAERYPILIVGGENAMVPLDPAAIDLVIETMLKTSLSLIFDLSEYLDHEQQALYSQIADSLFHHETTYRRKVRLIVEEAQIYAPQRTASGGSNKKKVSFDPVTASQKIAKRGRKRAIDSIWATQRPASLSKDILSQCNRFWFGGITAEQDYKAIKPFLVEAGISYPQIKALQPGEFYFYSKGFTKLLKVRKRHCKHAGATPEAQQTFQAITDVGLQSAVQALAQQISIRADEKRQEESEINKLKLKIRDLEGQLAEVKDELSEERMATKVINRIGLHEAHHADLLPNPMPRRRSASATSKKKALSMDDGTTAIPVSEPITVEAV